jgi:hypothetical protein
VAALLFNAEITRKPTEARAALIKQHEGGADSDADHPVIVQGVSVEHGAGFNRGAALRP